MELTDDIRELIRSGTSKVEPLVSLALSGEGLGMLVGVSFRWLLLSGLLVGNIGLIYKEVNAKIKF